jgi:hypothetical protein
MTVEHKDPEPYGIGYNEGEPIAESVDDYDQYPDSYEDSLTWAYRDVVRDVFKAVGGSHPWLKRELGVEVAGYAGPSREYDLEAPEDSDFHVTLEAHETEGDRAMDYGEYSRHIQQIGDPLTNERWLRQAVKRDYDAEDIAALFEWLDEKQVRDRLLSLGLVEDTEVDIGDETVDLSDYHARPWQDPRLLEKFDEAGYSLSQVAEALGCTTKAVTEQARAYKLTE